MQFPSGLIDHLKDVPGFDEQAFTAVHASAEQVTSIRLNPAKVAQFYPELIEEQIPWCPHGYYLTERPSFTLDPLLHAGAYYVQEASSMFLWHALEQVISDVNDRLKLIDISAAPGGKSTLLASLFPNALLIANEVIKQRAAILSENITKWGSPNVVVTNNDPSSFSKLEGYADVIVVDAPCSGSGMFRKDPPAMEHWSLENVEICSKRQHRILEDVIPALKEDGILVYSTCSYSREEDEDVMHWLKEQGLHSLPISFNEEWGIVETRVGDVHGYRFYPDKLKGEGFFIAVFRKTVPTDNSYPYGNLTKASKAEISICDQWVKDPSEKILFKQGDDIRCVDRHWEKDIAFLQKNLYIKQAGIHVGNIKGKDLVPAHDLAVSTIVDRNNIHLVALDREQAIQLLKKQNLTIDTTYKGWVLATYNDVGLAWLKVLQGRVNNYYPVEWRILKA